MPLCPFHKSVGQPPLLHSLVLGLGCFQEECGPSHSCQLQLEHSLRPGPASLTLSEAEARWTMGSGIDFSSVSWWKEEQIPSRAPLSGKGAHPGTVADIVYSFWKLSSIDLLQMLASATPASISNVIWVSTVCQVLGHSQGNSGNSSLHHWLLTPKCKYLPSKIEMLLH